MEFSFCQWEACWHECLSRLLPWPWVCMCVPPGITADAEWDIEQFSEGENNKLGTRTLSPYNLINWYSEARSTEAFGMCLEHIILTSGFTFVECYKVIAIINLNQNADVFVSFVFLSRLPMETPALSLPPRGIKMMLYYVELTHCCSLENPPACCA